MSMAGGSNRAGNDEEDEDDFLGSSASLDNAPQQPLGTNSKAPGVIQDQAATQLDQAQEFGELRKPKNAQAKKLLLKAKELRAKFTTAYLQYKRVQVGPAKEATPAVRNKAYGNVAAATKIEVSHTKKETTESKDQSVAVNFGGNDESLVALLGEATRNRHQTPKAFRKKKRSESEKAKKAVKKAADATNKVVSKTVETGSKVPSYRYHFRAGSWPVGVLTSRWGTRTTYAPAPQEDKYDYPSGQGAPKCMVKKTEFWANCCNGKATFPSWSQCKKSDKFDGSSRTQYGAVNLNGDFICNLEKVTTCAMDEEYGHDGNQFFEEFLKEGKTPRVECIRTSRSTISWKSARIWDQNLKKWFEGSDPEKAAESCRSDPYGYHHLHVMCDKVARQSVAHAQVECLQILPKY